jgi:dihydrofolate synthase/folylpolyglutamate synthase
VADPVAQYTAALDWVLGFADWERGVGWNVASSEDERWKLGRPRTLLDLAGAPDRTLRCLLVAGTKGKGSTAAMLDSIVRAAGWRSGLYTQPHLHSYRERIRLDGEPIGPAEFAMQADRLRGLVPELRRAAPEAGEPTSFELITVLALLAFARARVDLAILEVGLGGRLDATNVVDPALSVITSIGFDHTEILGSTLEAIATEKAGIIRPGGIVVAARQRPAARAAIVTRCRALQARCRFVAPFTRAPAPDGGAEQTVVKVGRARFALRLPLRGAHQRQNAAVAVAAARQLEARGLPLSAAAVRDGLTRVRWPGRFEVVPGTPTVVVDAAHTPESAVALARALEDERLPRPRWLVVAMLRDKDPRAFVRALRPAVDAIVVTTTRSPRTMPAARLAEACKAARAPLIGIEPTVDRALDVARAGAGKRGTAIAAGSFTVVTEARVALHLAPASLP